MFRIDCHVYIISYLLTTEKRSTISSLGLRLNQTPFKALFPLSEKHQIPSLIATQMLVILFDFMTSIFG